jgi:hypothetical protein
VPTATGRLLFVLVILAHERRRFVHVAVTDHPTAFICAARWLQNNSIVPGNASWSWNRRRD